MKILFYGLNYPPEQVGIGKYTGECVSWFSSRGHRVRVITSPPYFPQWRVHSTYQNSYSVEVRDRALVHRCPIWVPRRPTGLKRLLHLASFALSSFGPLLAQRSWKPDVVITVAPALFCAPGSLLFSRIVGRQCITWLHIQDFELEAAFELGLLKGSWFRSLAQFFEYRILQGFTSVSTISHPMLHSLSSKGLSCDRTYLLPNWVDLRVIYPQTGPNNYRHQLEIGDEQLILLYSGSMNKKQGLTMLVEVIHHLRDIPNLLWLFAGEGPTKAALMQATAGLHHVRHLPLQPAERLNDLLNAADIHLLPQKAAAADLVLPSKLLGMMASGRPVVACSPVDSELARIVTQVGRCVLPDDASAFAAALRDLILSPQQRSALGLRARAIAAEYFDVDTVLERFECQLTTEYHRRN